MRTTCGQRRRTGRELFQDFHLLGCVENTEAASSASRGSGRIKPVIWQSVCTTQRSTRTKLRACKRTVSLGVVRQTRGEAPIQRFPKKDFEPLILVVAYNPSTKNMDNSFGHPIGVLLSNVCMLPWFHSSTRHDSVQDLWLGVGYSNT